MNSSVEAHTTMSKEEDLTERREEGGTMSGRIHKLRYPNDMPSEGDRGGRRGILGCFFSKSSYTKRTIAMMIKRRDI